MALNIKDPTTDRLARELAGLTGESITVAVGTALRDRLERLTGGVPEEQRYTRMREIADRLHQLPVLDERPEDELLGYDEHGLPR